MNARKVAVAATLLAVMGVLASAPAQAGAPSTEPAALGQAVAAKRANPCVVAERGFTLGRPLMLAAHGKDPERFDLEASLSMDPEISLGFVLKNTGTGTVNPEYLVSIRDQRNRTLAYVMASDARYEGTPIFYLPPGGSTIIGATKSFDLKDDVSAEEFEAAVGKRLHIQVKCPIHTRPYIDFFKQHDMSMTEVAESTGSWANVPKAPEPMSQLPNHATFSGVIAAVACDESTGSGCFDGIFDWNYNVSGTFTNPGGYRRWNGTPMVIFRDASGRIIGGDSMTTGTMRCPVTMDENYVTTCNDLAIGETMNWTFESGRNRMPWDWKAPFPTVQGSVQPVFAPPGDVDGCPTQLVRPC